MHAAPVAQGCLLLSYGVVSSYQGDRALSRARFGPGNQGTALAGHEPGGYYEIMIAVIAGKDSLQVTIPTAGMTPDEVQDFVSWLRVESVVRRSPLTPEAAWALAEGIKSNWWQANERRFTAEGAESK